MDENVNNLAACQRTLIERMEMLTGKLKEITREQQVIADCLQEMKSDFLWLFCEMGTITEAEE